MKSFSFHLISLLATHHVFNLLMDIFVELLIVSTLNKNRKRKQNTFSCAELMFKVDVFCQNWNVHIAFGHLFPLCGKSVKLEVISFVSTVNRIILVTQYNVLHLTDYPNFCANCSQQYTAIATKSDFKISTECSAYLWCNIHYSTRTMHF